MSRRTYGTGQLEDVEFVSVPIPQQMQTRYGVNASTARDAAREHQRYPLDVITVIREAAALLDMTVTNFIKDSSYNTARAIVAKKEKANDLRKEHDLRGG